MGLIRRPESTFLGINFFSATNSLIISSTDSHWPIIKASNQPDSLQSEINRKLQRKGHSTLLPSDHPLAIKLRTSYNTVFQYRHMQQGFLEWLSNHNSFLIFFFFYRYSTNSIAMLNTYPMNKRKTKGLGCHCLQTWRIRTALHLCPGSLESFLLHKWSQWGCWPHPSLLPSPSSSQREVVSHISQLKVSELLQH